MLGVNCLLASPPPPSDSSVWGVHLVRKSPYVQCHLFLRRGCRFLWDFKEALLNVRREFLLPRSHLRLVASLGLVLGCSVAGSLGSPLALPLLQRSINFSRHSRVVHVHVLVLGGKEVKSQPVLHSLRFSELILRAFHPLDILKGALLCT